MNTWKSMTLSSVTFGLVMATILWCCLLGLPIAESAPSWAISFHQHMSLPLFFLAWLGYANLWALKISPASPGTIIGAALGTVMCAVFGAVLYGVLGMVFVGLFGGLLFAMIGGLLTHKDD